MTSPSAPDPAHEPIAIVGIGCRLPGGADTPSALWQLLRDEVDAIGHVPADRFDADALFDPRPATPGRIMSTWGGFLDGIEDFDADFFEIAPREAERLDPQQRLLLETACEALDDAGLSRDVVGGTNAGVFVGIWLDEFEDRLFADQASIDFYMTTGSGRYADSGRLSFFLDLLGPSLTVDTACSSSLVAVHLAVQSLRAGECNLALAGGANVILEPSITIAYSQSRMMAPDGRCKFGDVAADGYVRSDGAAMVALKRLGDALADGDRIHAVIRGSAVTNDGRSGGFLATPGQPGQEEMLRRAYARADVDPRTVQYVEAHGTGTAAGDPVELGALGAVVGAGRAADAPCLVGSIKSNIGHTEGAAGVAGLIKCVLALEHAELPASLHVNQPNPAIAWEELGVEVCAARRPWPLTDGPRRAAVSAFGIAGTNAHVVLEQAPVAPPAPVRETRGGGQAQLLVLSGNDPDARLALAASSADLLERAGADLAAVAAAAARRTALAHRLAVVAPDAATAVTALRAAAGGAADPNLVIGSSPARPQQVVFVFPGQGSQWLGMARDLLADEPVFAAALARCDAAIHAEAGWSVIELLRGAGAVERLDDVDVVQPMLFAIQVALAAQWRAWGVEPVAVVGHSMGEVAAAHVAGALGLEDAVAVICRRSVLLRRVRGQGAMAVVDLPEADVAAAIAGQEDAVSIAVCSSSRSTVISGDPAVVTALSEKFQADDVFCRPVNVDVASHSPQMDPLLDDLRAALAAISPATGHVPFESTVDGVTMDGAALDADYWARNLRQPVRLGDAIARRLAAGATAFVEISPHPVLLPAVNHVVREYEVDDVQLVASLRRDQPGRAALLAGLGALWCAGADVDWPVVVGVGHPHVDLPPYPWQRRRHWYEPTGRPVRRGGGHPLLGHVAAVPSDPGTVVWQRAVGDGAAFLLDHVVRGAAIMPTTGFLEIFHLAASAAAASAASGAWTVDGLTLFEPLALGGAGMLDVVVDSAPLGGWRCRAYSSDTDVDEDRGDVDGRRAEWRVHAEATVHTGGIAEPHALVDLDAIRARCPTEVDAAGHLDAMAVRGLAYAAAFRTVDRLHVGDREALGRLVAADAADAVERTVRILDGALQVALAALPASTARATFVPVGIEHLELAGELPDAGAWCRAAVVAAGRDEFTADVTVVDEVGTVLADLRGVHLRCVGAARDAGADLTYELDWTVVATDPDLEPDVEARDAWVLYAGDDGAAALAAQLRATGARCVLVTKGMAFERHGADAFTIAPDDVAGHRRIIGDVLGPDVRSVGIVYLWSASVGGDDLGAAEHVGAAGPLAVARSIGALLDEAGTDGDAVDVRLWLVTDGAQPIGSQDEARPTQAVTWGIGRTIATERPELSCTLVDVAPGSPDLLDELVRPSADQQVVRRAGRRRVARLRHAAPDLDDLDDIDDLDTVQTDCYRLVAAVPGSLDDLRLELFPRRDLAAGDVEIRVEAAALNFLDLLKAMGVYPGIEPSPDVALGAECAGVVVRVGSAVSEFSVGDQVVAMTPGFSTTPMLASYVRVPAPFVAPRPAGVSAEAACALPIAYLTAYHSLVDLARIRRGDRVLVHAATGGVGLAALSICRRVGAEVLATAGSEAKRDHLRSLGVEHVFDSRSIEFAAQVRAVTGGRGVDVVLNSLAGAAIPAGLATLAAGGRFIELGKRDVYAGARVDLRPLRYNCSFAVVDIAALTEDDPARVAATFREVMTMIASDQLDLLPIAVTPIGSAVHAFRTMSAAAHIGKLVLRLDERAAVAGSVRADGTYLITGGLGALGLAVAGRLVERGARHLVLLGRSAPTPAALGALQQLRAAGADVLVLSVDVADAGALAAALAQVRATMPALRGVVHAAGSLDDATVDRMEAAQLSAVLAPKMRGGWNLHTATLDDPLDWFVLFSSVAAVLGLAGQSNYAAANAYLDALAVQRRLAGRPACSIGWGPWSETGLAASDVNRGARLAAKGLGGLGTAEALDAFEQALTGDLDHVVVMRLDAQRWCDGEASSAALLADLVIDVPVAATGERSPGQRERLLEIPHPRRRGVLEDLVRAELAPVLSTTVDRIDRNRDVRSLGLDSLMSLELRNRLELVTGLTLSATTAFNHPTVAALAEFLALRLDVPLVATGVPTLAVPDPSLALTDRGTTA